MSHPRHASEPGGADEARLRIGVLEGDGIGHEIVPATVRVVDAAIAAVGLEPVDWVRLPFGQSAIESHGSPLPDETVTALHGLRGWILGPHDNAGYPEPFHGTLTPGSRIRRTFDLYANIRPAAALPGVRASVPDIDLVIVRENTEGFYADRNMYTGGGEFMPTADVAMSVAVSSRPACQRIARTAFDLARKRGVVGGRRRVTVAHKTNVLPLLTGMLVEACEEVSRQFPEIAFDGEHVDALAAHLVRRGGEYDVVVAENLFGDILSDVAGELAGSLGIAGSLNASDEQAMAQAAHGAAPDIAGRNRANPTALLFSAAMLLEWLSARSRERRLAEAATRIDHAVRATTESGVATADLGGLASTSEFTETVIAHVYRR